MQKMARFLFAHPFGKAMGLGFFSILGNVLAGSYVFEITKTDSHGVQFLDWSATPHSRSFWALLIVVLLIGLYGLAMAKFETQVQKTMQKTLNAAEARQRAIDVLFEPTLLAVKKEIEGGKLWSIDDVLKMISADKMSPS